MYMYSQQPLTSIGCGDGEHCHKAGVIVLKSVTQQLASLNWSSTINPNVLITLLNIIDHTSTLHPFKYMYHRSYIYIVHYIYTCACT